MRAPVRIAGRPALGLPSLGLLLATLLLAAVLLFAGAACSSTGGTSSGGGAEDGAGHTPQFGGPDVSAVIVTTDHAIGINRLVFGLVDRDGMPVRADEAKVQGLYLPPGQESDQAGQPVSEVRAEAVAKFVRWPVGQQGVFVAKITLDRTGFWLLKAEATTPEGRAVTAQAAFQVKAESDTPAIGQPAPGSVTPTVDDVGGVDQLNQITSANPPDPDLYRMSVRSALESGQPLVVVFSTPAFCVTATCGPQVEVISGLRDTYQGRANFIHVEVFQDPHLIEGRPSGGVAPAVEEWNLPSEPWTFVVDSGGRIRAKFEQFAAAEEIEAALQEALAAG